MRTQWYKVDDDRIVGASAHEVVSTDAYVPVNTSPLARSAADAAFCVVRYMLYYVKKHLDYAPA
jgi:hypothetical protein